MSFRGRRCVVMIARRVLLRGHAGRGWDGVHVEQKGPPPRDPLRSRIDLVGPHFAASSAAPRPAPLAPYGYLVGVASQRDAAPRTIRANSQVRSTGTYGVLKLTLHAHNYDWQFIPVAGKTFTDSGRRPLTPEPLWQHVKTPPLIDGGGVCCCVLYVRSRRAGKCQSLLLPRTSTNTAPSRTRALIANW